MLKVLGIVTFLCASADIEGQTSWAILGSVRVGQKIQVVEMNNKKHTGNFLSTTDSAITFTEGKSERSLQKVDVRSVKLRGQRRMRNVLIGLGAGAGSMALIGGVACAPEGSDWGWACAAAGGLLGAAVGMPIGALIPTGDAVVYIAEPQKSSKP
jgi:hypothetical protein